MTAQMSDHVSYRRNRYSLTAHNGRGLFDPRDYGLKPKWTSSANWRGFVCHYRIKKQTLSLDTLWIGRMDMPAGELLGIKPEPGGDDDQFDATYRRMNYKVPYTGGLLLARGFIRDLYVHMGFHPAWKFTEVHELIFDNGDLKHSANCSQAIAGLRERMLDRPLKPAGGANHAEIVSWIKQCFSQEYQIPVGRESKAAMVSEVEFRLLPVNNEPIILELEHPAVCPCCQTSSVKYRRVSSGRLVCLACGHSLQRPRTPQGSA